ncbi:hypothetical protein GCM10008986_00400 [Salinibacillus aidingensis]|uniref:AhpC/TSA family protein n=1 Tax=Salinibacillus aidingensis TaxID=237684 RepID=A0ABN1AM62_9BACI
MKSKVVTLLLVFGVMLTACSPAADEPVTLQNHAGEEVNIPGEKPVLFFFITTYT